MRHGNNNGRNIPTVIGIITLELEGLEVAIVGYEEPEVRTQRMREGFIRHNARSQRLLVKGDIVLLAKNATIRVHERS